MTAYQQYTDEIVYGWRKMHGQAGVYIYRPISPVSTIVKLIQLYCNANKDANIVIITNDLLEFNDIHQALKFITKNKININILNKGYIDIAKDKQFDLCITVNVDEYDYLKYIVETNNIKHYMCIFDNRIVGHKTTINRESLMPFVTVNIQPSKLIEEYIHWPVEDKHINVILSDKTAEEYKAYTKYITESMRIYGNLETLDRCRVGDKIMGWSAIHVCEVVANNNGWSYDLDTSTEFGRELDNKFNPNALHTRALNVYNIMRNRKNLVINAEEKIPHILQIVNDNIDKNILIVSATGEFALKVSEECNKLITIIDKGYVTICGNYHNEIPDTIQKDIHDNPVLVKSGKHKGEQKIIGSQKQSTLAEKAFNENKINVLSIKATSDSSLSIKCDIIIITSPLCTDIFNIKRRFQNILINSVPANIYTLYCGATIEEYKANKLEESSNYVIIRDSDNIFVAD